jgi:hypothetical protein
MEEEENSTVNIPVKVLPWALLSQTRADDDGR